jgi:hypothetical protein
MNISPHTTVFSTTASGFSAAPEPHDDITAKDAEMADLRAQLAEAQQRIAEFERLQAKEEARKQTVHVVSGFALPDIVEPEPDDADDSETRAFLYGVEKELAAGKW